MSAYSDWKCGAITEEEYNQACAWEDARDRYYEDRMWMNEPEWDEEDEEYDG